MVLVLRNCTNEKRRRIYFPILRRSPLYSPHIIIECGSCPNIPLHFYRSMSPSRFLNGIDQPDAHKRIFDMYIILGIFFQCLIKLIDQLAMACTVIKLSSRHLGILYQALPGAVLIQLIQDILNDGYSAFSI